MVYLTKSTRPVREKNIKRGWQLMDARNMVLGRFAGQISKYLTGKHKRNYVSHLDMGDNVVVINALHIEVTGNKSQSKLYSRYSGYPGGLKQIPFETMKERKPGEIIRHAVMGMLPKNKLRDRMITRLFIYKDEKHPHGDKLEIRNSKSETNHK